jgi:hypothetical protein
MVKKSTLQFTLILFVSIMSGCYQRPADEPEPEIGNGNSDFLLGNSATRFHGVRTKDESLKAITIPCQNDNTFRLYYSDSVVTLGLPDSLTVVSYSKKANLRYKECCIEVTSSAGDTWLSTGTEKFRFAAGTGPISSGIDHLVWLRHYTSVPQSDSTNVIFNLIPE